MVEKNGGRRVYRARQTPTKTYPASPPKTPESIEFLFHSINRQLLDQTEAAFRDQIVTSQILYKPAILTGARVNFSGNRWQIHSEKDIWKIVLFPSKHQVCDWNENLNPRWNPHDLVTTPEPESFFVYDHTHDFSAERFEELKEDFLQHLVSKVVLEVEYNPVFRMDRKFDESAETFLSRCLDRARGDFEKEVHNLTDTLQRLEDRLKQRFEREVQVIGKDQYEYQPLRMEDSGRNIQEEIETHDSFTTIENIKKEMEELEKMRRTKLMEFEEKLTVMAKEREKDILRINRSHVALLRFALIWLPYTEYVIQEEDTRRLLLLQSF